MKLLSEKYFPGIHNFGWHAEAENMKWFQWKQIWKWGERNTSLEFISLRSCSADFDLNLEAVAVILSEKANNSQQSTCTGGLRKPLLGSKWFKRHISRPLHFLHPLTGGSRTRLSIRRQDPNNYSDTETRTLSTLLLLILTIIKLFIVISHINQLASHFWRRAHSATQNTPTPQSGKNATDHT